MSVCMCAYIYIYIYMYVSMYLCMYICQARSMDFILTEAKWTWNNECRAPTAQSPWWLGGLRKSHKLPQPPSHFRAFEIKWRLFGNIFKWLFIQKSWLKFENNLLWPRSKVDFDWGYKFYGGSCLRCLICGNGAVCLYVWLICIKICRTWLNAGFVLMTISLSVAFYLIVFLSFYKKVNPDEWESVHPAAIPIATGTGCSAIIWWATN